jgi:hypothetical protein
MVDTAAGHAYLLELQVTIDGACIGVRGSGASE